MASHRDERVAETRKLVSWAEARWVEPVAPPLRHGKPAAGDCPCSKQAVEDQCSGRRAEEGLRRKEFVAQAFRELNAPGLYCKRRVAGGLHRTKHAANGHREERVEAVRRHKKFAEGRHFGCFLGQNSKPFLLLILFQ